MKPKKRPPKPARAPQPRARAKPLRLPSSARALAPPAAVLDPAVSRVERLARLRADPAALPAIKAYYRDHPIDFIDDWAMTSDPRNKNRGLPVEVPFVLFPKQREMGDFVLERMQKGEPGIIEKSRDCGASWLAMCLAATLCLFDRGVVVGVGSAKESLVDRSGDPDSLLWKVRFFLSHLPQEFRGSWDESRHAAHMRIVFPDTGSAIVGQAGDQIGRGGRTSLFIIDESAHLERPQLIEASLASNCDSRIDISTPCGRANSFAARRFSGRIPVCTVRWTDDPRKDADWYQRQCELLDPVTRAQEIDLSYDSSAEGILIPVEWIHAAIDANTKLSIQPSGERRGALDPADQGKDRNAFAARHGVHLEYLKSWSGKGSDIYQTVVRAFGICQERAYTVFDYDQDGLGAGVRGDAAQLNISRREAGKREIVAEPFRGSGAVFDPDGTLIEGRFNRDFFANLKAQAWWALRLRFQATHRAVIEKLPFNADEIISIDPKLEELSGLLAELVQPTYSINGAGKIVVDKAPDGVASPNLADAICMCFNPFRPGSYFAGPSVRSVSQFKTYDLPQKMHHVFAVISFGRDAAGVVWAASTSSNDGLSGPPLHILDWDLHAIDGSIEAWVRDVLRKLDDWVMRVSSVVQGGKLVPYGDQQLFFDDPVGTYAEYMRQRGVPGAYVEREFGKDALPPFAERFARAKPYVNVGLAVIDKPCEHESSFGGVTRNHLREILTAAQVVDSNPLAQAFAAAVLMCFKSEQSVLPPDMDEFERGLGVWGVA